VSLTFICEVFEFYAEMKAKEGCKWPKETMKWIWSSQITNGIVYFLLQMLTKVWSKV